MVSELGDRLAAGRRVLAPLTKVRILVPQPYIKMRPHRLARSRTSAFHAGNRGSNPLGDAKKDNKIGTWENFPQVPFCFFQNFFKFLPFSAPNLSQITFLSLCYSIFFIFGSSTSTVEFWSGVKPELGLQ